MGIILTKDMKNEMKLFICNVKLNFFNVFVICS